MDKSQLRQLISAALIEDIGDGDHTTLSCIPYDAMGKAELRLKQDGTVAGIEVARRIFQVTEPSSELVMLKKDGDSVSKGETAFEVKASVHTILGCERLVLNCMQRMSGIATLTKQYVQKLEGTRTKLLDTRKTTPNFRLLEKEAVSIGGGTNHRFGLYDMILLKDNHIDFAGGIESAIEKAHQYVQFKRPSLKIEVETRSLEDVDIVCRMGKGKVFRIMFDNFSLSMLQEAVQLVDGRFETEASGGVNLETVRDIAATGVDFVSVGALIHQAQSLDMSLKAII